MATPSIIVVGPEGSGTTLLWRCVAAHPQMRGLEAREAPPARGPIADEGQLLHLSLPTLRPMRWIGGWAVARGARVIVVRRSPLHTVFSAYRRFYQRPRPAWRNYFRAVDLEASWIARHEPLCVAYEDLVRNPAAVLRRVYEFLGFDAAFVPPIALTDRNDERWRQDAPFAAFARRTLGLPGPLPSPTDVDPPAATLDICLHGTRIVIADASGAGIAAALRAALPPTLDEPHGERPPDARYLVDRRAGAAGAVTYRVIDHGETRARARDAERLVDWLRGEIDAVVAERSRRGLFVHAGVVGWRGHAIVLPGRSMSGKSRLVSELVRCGATYYSDEFAVFDEEGRVLPYARQAVLRDRDVAADLGERDAAAPLPLGLIVATHYRAGAIWQPRHLSGVRAVVPIIDNTVLARQESRQLLRLSARLARRAVTLEGARPEAAEIAPKLLAHLDALRADSGPRRSSAATAVVERAQAVVDAATPADEILPPRYVRVDGLLSEAEHARLLAYARGREADFAASGVVDPSGVHRVNQAFRRSATLHDLEEVWPLFETRLRRLLPHVRRELGVPWFPVAQSERQLTVHRQGDFFQQHNDDGRPELAERWVTCVYYFHGRPKRFSGGELKIYERLVRGGWIAPGSGHVTLEPMDNSAVFFASSSPHEVCPVQQTSDAFGDSRFSITVWFRRGPFPALLGTPAPAEG